MVKIDRIAYLYGPLQEWTVLPDRISPGLNEQARMDLVRFRERVLALSTFGQFKGHSQLPLPPSAGLDQLRYIDKLLREQQLGRACHELIDLLYLYPKQHRQPLLLAAAQLIGRYV